jgi:hypothetical protein
LLERESTISRLQLDLEQKSYSEIRSKEDNTRLQANLIAFEEKIEDKNQTITRLNSRLQSLEKLG